MPQPPRPAALALLVIGLAGLLLLPEPAEARRRKRPRPQSKPAPQPTRASPSAGDEAGEPSAPPGDRAPAAKPDAAAVGQGVAESAAKPPAGASAATKRSPAGTVPVSTLPFVSGDAKKVFLFLDPVRGPKAGVVGELGGVFTRLAVTRLNAIEAVRLKTWREMGEVPAVLARYGDLEALDRVSLITIKNVTGFDGLVRMSYAYDGPRVLLKMTLFDFRNGRVFRKRELKRPVDAELFAVLERDLIEFATTVRRSYRVTLRIESSPAGAEVHLNGRRIGRTPLTTEVKAGKHHVMVVQEGFKTWQRRFLLSDGDRLEIHAVLYNPLAARFLNAPPGFRVDSRQLELGYRYIWLNMPRPGVGAGHFMELSWLLRFLDLDVGLRYAAAADMRGENRLDTFVGEGQGVQRYDLGVYQFHALARLPLFEKYAFASVALAGSGGLTWASSDDRERVLGGWSPSGMLGVELVSRLLREGNFSLEARFDLGMAWAGQMPYTERTFSLFGAGEVRERRRGMWGPTASLALRLVFWNGIF